MSASVAVKVQTKELKAVDIEKAATINATDQLTVAVEALSAIAAENDLTCMRALFRMRRLAEVALDRIGAGRSAARPPH